MLKRIYGSVTVLILCLLFSCSPYYENRGRDDISLSRSRLTIQYSVQAGAFESPVNAQRFAGRIQEYADAFWFRDGDGLYKVRFGNFEFRQRAQEKAERLKRLDIIRDFFIIPPGYEAKKLLSGGTPIRSKIVAEAEKYLGIPYKWGGESAGTGFDCSGLALTVYRKVGIDLPRTAGKQYGRGRYVERGSLAKGDLVFFESRGRISHVGIYIGSGRFIHAPGRGKTVCRERLARKYYRKRYAGARTYLRM